MADFENRDVRDGQGATAAGLLLIQIAASRAEIGPFARIARETPREATTRYATRRRPGGSSSSLGRRASGSC
jgi:hypothetical protein